MIHRFYSTESIEGEDASARRYWVLATSEKSAIDKRAMYDGRAAQSYVAKSFIFLPPYSYIVDAWPTEYGIMSISQKRGGAFEITHRDTREVTFDGTIMTLTRERILPRFHINDNENYSFLYRTGIFEKYDQSVNSIKVPCLTSVFPQTSHGWSFSFDQDALCVCFENEVDAMAYRLIV